VNSGTNFSGKTINLGADIDLLNLEWIPIGTKENPFRGKFNGADKEISNLKIDKPEENYKGLFGVIGTGTVIKDMSMKDVNITGYGWLGAVAGWHENSSTLTIDNVDVTDITLNGHRMIGGVLGQSYNGAQAEIKDCDLTNVTINNSVRDKNGNGDKSGGIVGHAGSIKLTSNSVTNLNLYAYRDSGGITGYSETLSNISGNIVTTGNLRLDKTQEMATGEAVDNKWNLGAIVGRPKTKTQVLGEGNSFDEVTSSIKEKHDEDFRVIETVEVGYTPITVEESGSIQAAIDAAADGDVIIVGDGEYTENLTINKAITLKSLNGRESTEIAGTITITADDVTVEGFTVTAQGYYAVPVIHMIDIDNVNILNNTVVADDTAYGAIGTSSAPAKITGKISGNTVTGMIMVGTDGAVEVSDNIVTLTPASTEGICFYPVGSTAVITVTGNTVGVVTEGNVQIKVNEKPLSVNGENSELDMLAAITADNNEATAKLSWVSYVSSGEELITELGKATIKMIILENDINDLDSALDIERDVTIDGEGNSINAGININNGADVKIKDLTVENVEDRVSRLSTKGYETIIIGVRSGTLTADNITIRDSREQNRVNLVGISVQPEQTLKLTDSTLVLSDTDDSNVYGVYVQRNGIAEISNNSINLEGRNAFAVGVGLGSEVNNDVSLSGNTLQENSAGRDEYMILVYTGTAIEEADLYSWVDTLIDTESGERAYINNGSGYYAYPIETIAADVDYAAVWNKDRETFYIEVSVPDELLDAASIKSISTIKEAGVEIAEPVALTPDTDKVLWFGVAGKDGLVDDKDAGEYAYKVIRQDGSEYIFNFTYNPESVTGGNPGTVEPTTGFVVDESNRVIWVYNFWGWFEAQALIEEDESNNEWYIILMGDIDLGGGGISL
jgi:hypothetical protein